MIRFSVRILGVAACLSAAACVANEWIDLGDEGATLYLCARMTTPEPGESRELILATSGGQQRVSVGVDDKGRYRLWLYQRFVTGEPCRPGETVTLVAEIRSHAEKPDDVRLKVYGDDAAIPEKPPRPGDWDLVNSEGHSDANLARILVAPAAARKDFQDIRVAETWQELRETPALDDKLTAGTPVVPAPAPDLSYPDPVDNPGSALMLDLPGTGKDPTKIDFAKLPRLPAKHAMISDVRDRAGKWVHQHAYLAFHGDCYWAMWSDGPGVPRPGATPEEHRNIVPDHDRADTRVSYATSKDGLHWSEPKDLSGPPRKKGYGWIARGFWQRDGELLALASHFHAPGYAGKGLSLEAFHFDPEEEKWAPHGTVRDDSLNNFPPKRLPGGQWMMTRRDHRRQVSVLIGGTKAFDQWSPRHLAKYDGEGRPEEPYWYILPDGKSLVGLIRDNGGSKRLLRVFSSDDGQSWSKIVRTNFPDATSKFFALRTSRGYYALVSNANPAGRDPLVLSISRDGLVYTHTFYLAGGRHIDYPHLIEHDDTLFISFSGAKQTVEVLSVPLKTIDSVLESRSGGGS